MTAYLVRMGRGTVESPTSVKTLFFITKRRAMTAANAFSYVLWELHAFNRVTDEPTRFEHDGFWMEFITDKTIKPRHSHD